MSNTASLLRTTAGLVVLLPFALLTSACGDETTTAGSGGTGATATGTGGSGTSSTGMSTTGTSTTGTSGDGGAGGGGVVPDTTPPTVVSTSPAADAKSTAVSGAITVTFSEAMAPLTITAATFSVKLGAVDVPGVVTYFNETATFVPGAALALGMTYTATITTAATDLAGNKLAAPRSWNFITDATPPKGPSPVLLGAAGDYAILAKSAITNVPTSAITGNLGLSPAAASFITGFSLTRAGAKWTAPQVIGSVFAADGDPPTPINLTTAISDMQTAYTDAAGRSTPDTLDLGAGTIGGLTMTPGLYKWASSVTIPSDLTISGAPNDVWIFQITGDLTMSAAKNITLSGGAQAKNIFWQVAGLVDLGTTSHAEGVILSKTSIKMGTGASINGRLLAQTAVNIASSTVKVPTP